MNKISLLKIPCYFCFQKLKKVNFINLELANENSYKLECSKKHSNLFFIGRFKYEILFERGLLLLIGGYTGESVNPFKVSLERFYEVYIKLVMIKNGCSWKEIKKCWNKIDNFSERQFGLFMGLYLNENKVNPPLLSDSQSNFRNKSVHKGNLPLKKDVIDFANSIYTMINDVIDSFKNSCNEKFYDIIRSKSWMIYEP